MSTDLATQLIVLAGGGYSEHAPNEAEPVVDWLAGLGVGASVFRYPLLVRHPAPLDALRAEIRRLTCVLAGELATCEALVRQPPGGLPR